MTDTGVRAGVCTGPGPCETEPFGAGNNWVNKVGGLPLYIRAVAHALQKKGHSESSAIATAVATVKHWAAGGGNVTAATRARAAAAVAEWEAKKGAAHGSRDAGGIITETGSSAATLLPVGPNARQAAAIEARNAGPHAFTGRNLAKCGRCGRPAADPIHTSRPIPAGQRASGAYSSGHPFYGNQWSAAVNSGATPAELAQLAAAIASTGAGGGLHIGGGGHHASGGGGKGGKGKSGAGSKKAAAKHQAALTRAAARHQLVLQRQAAQRLAILKRATTVAQTSAAKWRATAAHAKTPAAKASALAKAKAYEDAVVKLESALAKAEGHRHAGPPKVEAGLRVGPKGYIHGWIFVGIPAEGDEVFHPLHGHGSVHRVREGGNGRKWVSVKWHSGQYTSHDAVPAAGKPRLVPREQAPEAPKPELPKRELPKLPHRPSGPTLSDRLKEHRPTQPPPPVPTPALPTADDIKERARQSLSEFTPSSGTRKLTKHEALLHLSRKLISNGVEPAIADRSAKVIADKHETHILADGSIVHFADAARITPAKKAVTIRTVQEIRRRNPERVPVSVFAGSGRISPYSGKAKRFGAGVRGYAVMGSPNIWVSPASFKASEDPTFARNVESGWFMNAGKDRQQIEYVLAHEYGHTIDVPSGFGFSGAHKIETTNALTHARSHMSKYGQKDRAETFAEAYAEWFLSGGKTVNEGVQEIARAEGWR